MERLEAFDDAKVRGWLGKWKPNWNLLDFRKPILVGPATMQDYYFEFKRTQIEGMSKVLPIIEEVQADFAKEFGRGYGVIEEYRTEDAEAVVLLMGSACGTMREAVDALRAEGKKVGMVKLRVYRPLPHQVLKKALARFRSVAVMDRVDAVNSYGGPLFTETTSLLYDLAQRPKVLSYVYGLGGKEFTPVDAATVLEGALAGSKDELVTYIGVR
jgi:pyruvate ferredoxin oxidoreductase alpha subunit